MTMRPPPMRGYSRVKRFVYDLGEAVGQLTNLGDFRGAEETPKAWIVEHLRSYHNLDVIELGPLTRLHDVEQVDLRCGRVAEVLTRDLYKMFFPMSVLAMEAEHTDMQFRHNVLTVDLYGCEDA